MPLSIHQILTGYILPALVIVAGLIIAWRPWQKPPRADGRWIAPPLMAAMFFLAFVQLSRVPKWPPGTGDVTNWIAYFVVPAGLLGLLDALLSPPSWLRFGLLVVLSRLAVRALLLPLVIRTKALSGVEAENWIDGLSIAIAILWLSTDALAEKVRGISVPLVLFLFATGAAIYLVLSENLSMGFVAGSIAALSAAAAVATFWPNGGRMISLSQGAVLTLIVPLVGLLICGYFYGPEDPSPMSQWAGAILLSAPILAWAGDLPGVRRSPNWARLCVRLLSVILAIGIAIGLSAKARQAAAAAETAAGDEGWGSAK
jgi:hypothetical protein